MASAPVEIQTKLPIKQAAELFQQSMRVSKLSEFKGLGTKFEKPPRDGAFGDLDDDPPNFEVMAIMGGGGSDWQKSGVAMYAWNRPDHTELRLVTGKNLLSLGSKAKGKIRKFVDAVQAADPSMQHSPL